MNNLAKKELSQQQLESIKESLISYKELMSISRTQRFEHILPYYFSKYTAKKLSKIWDIPIQRIYTMKSQMKSFLKNNNNPSINTEKNVKDEVIEIDASKEYVKLNTEHLSNGEDVAVFNAENKDVEIFEMLDKFYFTINQTSKGSSIVKKLNVLVSLLDDEDEEYDVYITVKQK